MPPPCRLARCFRGTPPPDAAASSVEITGSSVNLPDMSATLDAKVTVSEAAQQDPRRLAIAYDDMAAKFATQGLNLAAVAAMRQYFANLEGPGPAEPLRYAEFPAPLPPGAVRLSLVFFQRSNPALAELVHRAATDIVASLPPGTKYHLNDPGARFSLFWGARGVIPVSSFTHASLSPIPFIADHYHITVFMTSQPHTLRPSPLVPGNELPKGLTAEVLAVAAAPTDVDGEVAALRRAAAATPAPTFRVHRLLMADSGTLLLCSLDASGVIAGLRSGLKDAFPGAPPRQSTIFHASVARVLGDGPLAPAAVAAVQEACDRWSDRLRGREFKVNTLHYVMEERFTTVEGPAVALPFGGVGGGGGGGNGAA